LARSLPLRISEAFMIEQKIIIVLIFIAAMVAVAVAVRLLSFSQKSKSINKVSAGEQLEIQSKLILEQGVTIYAVNFGSQKLIINVSKGNSGAASVTQIMQTGPRLPLTSAKFEVQ